MVMRPRKLQFPLARSPPIAFDRRNGTIPPSDDEGLPGSMNGLQLFDALCLELGDPHGFHAFQASLVK